MQLSAHSNIVQIQHPSAHKNLGWSSTTSTCESFDKRRTGPVISVYPSNNELWQEKSSMWILKVRTNQYATTWTFGLVQVRQNFFTQAV